MGLVMAGCASVPGGPEASEAPAEERRDPGAFSARQAWHHLGALAEIGPRVSGTRGAERARRYLREQLEASGVIVGEVVDELPPETADGEPREAVHLFGRLPGASDDRFVLAASYDTRAIEGVEFVGANASASGPAVILELARALSQQPELTYSVQFLLVDGDALPATDPDDAFPGSRALAARMASSDDGFSKVRLAVFFQQVGDVDLQVARDLRSHHIYREFFWEAAAAVGRGIYFPSTAGVESVAGGHVEFIENGLPRTVAIADPRFGGSEVPGRYAASDQDSLARCSADSLGVVGEVTLEALDRISSRLARIDRFRESPLAGPRPESDSSPAELDPEPRQDPVAEPELTE